MSTNGGEMGLNETSRAIGRLEAGQEAAKTDIAELKERTESMDAKLDKLLMRTNHIRWNVRHWVTLIASGSVGGGGIAHVLRKLLE